MRTREFLGAKLGLIGIGLGTLALLIAMVSFFEGPFQTPPPPPSLKETAKRTLSDVSSKIAAKLKNETNSEAEVTPQPPQQSFGIDRILSISVLVLGIGAMALGVLSFARREYFRVATSAAAMGLSAILFQYFALYILGVLFIFFIIIALGNALDGF